MGRRLELRLVLLGHFNLLEPSFEQAPRRRIVHRQLHRRHAVLGLLVGWRARLNQRTHGGRVSLRLPRARAVQRREPIIVIIGRAWKSFLKEHQQDLVVTQPGGFVAHGISILVTDGGVCARFEEHFHGRGFLLGDRLKQRRLAGVSLDGVELRGSLAEDLRLQLFKVIHVHVTVHIIAANERDERQERQRAHRPPSARQVHQLTFVDAHLHPPSPTDEPLEKFVA